MREHILHKVIGRALTEPEFRAALLERPGEAIRDFSFSEEDRSIIGSVRAVSLEEFAQTLREHINGESPELIRRKAA